MRTIRRLFAASLVLVTAINSPLVGATPLFRSSHLVLPTVTNGDGFRSPLVRDPRGLPEYRPAVERWDPRNILQGASRRSRRAPRANIDGDERWSDGFGLPVTDGDIHAAIEFKGSLVVAGRFTRVGDVAANNIARWDGTAWHPLGQGIEGGTVSTLAIHQGDLVAGGDYWFAGGIVCRSIARWNGTDWSPFGRGLEDALTNPREVRAIGSDSNALVVAVDVFIENYYGDPTPSPYPFLLFSWSGTDWVPLSPGANGPVWTFAFHDGAMFAGGAFDSIGNVPAKGVARWDGSTWSEVGGGIGDYGRSVNAMVTYSGQLIIGGGFDSAGGNSASNVAAWETGYLHGRPGYVVDHIVPLSKGGSDDPSNMQLQTIQDAKAKDKTERK
jgi:hypothetical protein